VSLATLVNSPGQWEGKRVEIVGRLERFTDADGSSYGVIQDEAENRIGLKRIEPWRALIGKRVIAEGTVEFDPSFGEYLAEPRLSEAPP
jgi:hypothetical protein